MKSAKFLRTLTLGVSALLFGALTAPAQVSKAFVDAPANVFPLLDRNTRLDMLDYFNSGMTTQSANNVGGKSSIVALSPRVLKINMTAASDYQLVSLPLKNDTVYAVITTVKTPAPDSRVDIYGSDWSKLPTERFFNKPAIDEWLTSEGKANQADVNAFVPFLLVSYDFDPVSEKLVLTNNTRQFLSDDIYEIVAEWLKPRLNYRWDGRKFAKAD